MKMPWANKTGLARVATILPTILLISLELCGANFVAVISITRFGFEDSTPAEGHIWPARILIPAGMIELVGIAIGLLGLIGCLIAFIIRDVRANSIRTSNHED